jgi:hypothetical protein
MFLRNVCIAHQTTCFHTALSVYSYNFIVLSIYVGFEFFLVVAMDSSVF